MNQYSKRRQLIENSFQSNTAALIFSGNPIMCSEDESYPFKVNRNFYYLTGIDAQGMALLMQNIDGKISETLFILPYDEELAKWVGGRMLKDEARRISEVVSIEDIRDLDDEVASILNKMRKDATFKFYFDMWHYNMDQNSTPAIEYVNKLKERYPALIVKDIYPILTNMRLIKDETEINEIRKAIHTTNLGIIQMMNTAAPGVNEMTMEGVFDFVLRKTLCRENAFQTIAASGKRATILHYSDNNCDMEDGELFLCDLGATSNHYCADITRTFPVNGKFTPRQREIYEIVLGAQKIVEEYAEPHTSLRELNQRVIDYYKEELPKHGLKKDVREYYYHSVSHHLGLDTHDVDIDRDAKLVAGNVITNEPGLYIEEEGIGIRIEDDLLITATGNEVLSKEIIKLPDEIESYMGQQH